jgi:hypothetical protein
MRIAWSYVVFPVKTESPTTGSAFDLEGHLSVTDRNRAAIPTAVYDCFLRYCGPQSRKQWCPDVLMWSGGNLLWGLGISLGQRRTYAVIRPPEAITGEGSN